MADFKQHMIINSVPAEECRIAILEDNRLEELYAESTTPHNGADHVGNIYLGKVMNVEASIQAAFVDFGIDRNGFLHISDLHPMYFPRGERESTERVGQKTPHRSRPPIQRCLKRGQEVVVQVLKEGIGTKGPTLTSYLSIPGRYLVMLPNMERSGVSRRLEDYDQRREMRQMLDSLNLPDNFGFIMRTAAIDRPKSELKRDLAFLQRLWKSIEKKRSTQNAPNELYCESDLLIRTIRDVMSPNVTKIVIDDSETLNRVREFLRIVTPRKRSTIIEQYDNPLPIFHHYGIEEQITQIHAREVLLPAGGTLVIDQTEAMVTIDVNSGKMRRFQDAESTAYKTNLEAVDEISRQLRLRDLGGLVLMDLIDMRQTSHQRDVENRLRDMLKRDRAKTEHLRISRFGIIEMTRQRMRPALRMSYYADCPTCKGSGHIKTADVCAKEAVRELVYLTHHPKVARIDLVISDIVAGVLLSKYRRKISDLEDKTGKSINIRVSKSILSDIVEFYAYSNNGTDLDVSKLDYTQFKKTLSRTDKSEQSIREASVEDQKEHKSGQTSENQGRKPKKGRKTRAETAPHSLNKVSRKSDVGVNVDVNTTASDVAEVSTTDADINTVDNKDSKGKRKIHRRVKSKRTTNSDSSSADKTGISEINSDSDESRESSKSSKSKGSGRWKTRSRRSNPTSKTEPLLSAKQSAPSEDITENNRKKKKKTRSSKKRTRSTGEKEDTLPDKGKLPTVKSENKNITPAPKSNPIPGKKTKFTRKKSQLKNTTTTTTSSTSTAGSSGPTGSSKSGKTKSQTDKAGGGTRKTKAPTNTTKSPAAINHEKSKSKLSNKPVKKGTSPETVSPAASTAANKKKGRLYQTRRRLSTAQANLLITDDA